VMDVTNALNKWRDALQVHAGALEVIWELTRQSPAQDIRRATNEESQAWRRLGAARKGLVDAHLESIGW
jgi:ferric-dicitrate binding protein FerR (iron transport regulator)